MFIARVSKGRTVREFIVCVLIVPTLACVAWMAVFGGTAVDQYLNDGYQGVAQTVNDWQPELSLFKMLEVLPLSGITSFIGIVLVIVFFVTSSDSGSLVIDTITAGGKTEGGAPSSPARQSTAGARGVVGSAVLSDPCIAHALLVLLLTRNSVMVRPQKNMESKLQRHKVARLKRRPP